MTAAARREDINEEFANRKRGEMTAPLEFGSVRDLVFGPGQARNDSILAPRAARQ